MPTHTPAVVASTDMRASRLRAFNRFYTRRIGVLQEALLDSGFNLAESRLLFELAQQRGRTAAELSRTLQLDAGYLSRLLTSLKARGLVRGSASAGDGRAQALSLTAAGKRAFAPLDRASHRQAQGLLAALDDRAQRRLVQALATVESLLGEGPAGASATTLVLRPHRPGDIGWIIGQHGRRYAEEYGWDGHFEALVAQIGAGFIERFDARREACWIAERLDIAGEPEPVGCVMLVQARDDDSGEPDPGVAQLRLLLVEPAARGLGLGRRLVDECTRFARQCGYHRLRLWTQSCLTAARAIYQAAGYRRVGVEPHHSFGHDLVGEVWELDLRA